MFRFHVMAALAGAVSVSSAASASDIYRPLPPVSGTLHAGRHGIYGDRGLGPVRAEGPGLYQARRGGYRRMPRRFAEGTGGAFESVGRRRDRYGVGGPLTVRYGEPRLRDRADAGLADYAGQGFVPEAAGFGAGPVGYDQVSQPYGASYGTGGGLGVYTAGAYGPGPRIIAVPAHYNVGVAAGGAVHYGCGCARSGLFGSFGGPGAY